MIQYIESGWKMLQTSRKMHIKHMFLYNRNFDTLVHDLTLIIELDKQHTLSYA